MSLTSVGSDARDPFYMMSTRLISRDLEKASRRNRVVLRITHWLLYLFPPKMLSFTCPAAVLLLSIAVRAEAPTPTINETATLTARQQIIGTSFVDFSEAGVCRSLSPNGGVQFGNSIWENFDVDQMLVNYLTANPPDRTPSNHLRPSRGASFWNSRGAKRHN